MKTIVKILLAQLWLITLQLSAQDVNDPSYLYKIGTKQSIQSKILGEERDFWIQVPPDSKPYDRFPVVYVLDGGEQMSGLTAVYNYYWGHYLPKMILVGISNKDNRTRDLTPTKINGVSSGEARRFTEFIQQELIPFVDGHYATTSYRTLIGHSHAGLFAINTFINHPNLFSNYIAIDPSMDWDNQKFLNKSLKKLDHIDLQNKSLFISLASPLDRSNEAIGIEEVMKTASPHSVLARSTLTLCKALESKQSDEFRFRWKYYPDDIHGSVPLPTMIDALRYTFEWYQLKDASKFNNPETPTETLRAMIDARAQLLSKRFGYTVPPADEELLSMAAQMYVQMGQLDKVELFLSYAAKFYPKSEEAQGQLAEYYLQTNQPNKAVTYLTKAYELSRNARYKQKIQEIQSEN